MRFGEWLPEWDALLGTLPDGELGKQIGCCKSTVLHHRRKLGIPPCRTRTVPCTWCGADLRRPTNAGVTSVCCKKCKRLGRSEWWKKYYQANAARIVARKKRYYQANAERCQEYNRKWQAANRDLMALYRRRYADARRAREKAEEKARKDQLVAARVADELKEERNQLGWDHYGWARSG